MSDDKDGQKMKWYNCVASVVVVVVVVNHGDLISLASVSHQIKAFVSIDWTESGSLMTMS